MIYYPESVVGTVTRYWAGQPGVQPSSAAYTFSYLTGIVTFPRDKVAAA